MITTAFSSRVTNWPLFWIANLLALGLIALSGAHPLGPGLIVLIVALVVTNVTISSVRVTVGSGVVSVYYGLLGWPRFRYPISTISAAEARDLPASQLAGWGIHWSPWRGTRLTIRSGPVLVLHRHGRRPVTISCNDAPTAVALIEQG